MKYSSWVLLVFLAAGVVPHALHGAEQRPNVLLILADDCTYNDLSFFGGQNARTPHLDALAAEGLVFNRAFVSMAMCQPCRSELYTGQYPLRNGCAWNHSASRPTTRSLPQHLGALGYRVGLAGKADVFPHEAYPFEKIAGFDANCVRNPTQPHNLAGVREFIRRNDKQPFCLVIGLVEPHKPWVMGDPSQYPIQSLKLPPYLADTPETRRQFARYLAEITYMDGQVGEILAALKETDAAANTLVLFSSEQGAQFPGCKWTNWNLGLHTALLARWPGRIAPGTRTDALVQYADVAPTLIELAGGDSADPAYAFDGTSFVAVLRGAKQTHRAFAYGAHNNLPEGRAYPIRSVTDGQWHYIRNLTPGELFIQKYMMGLPRNRTTPLGDLYWASWLGASWDHPEIYRLIKRYMSRPAEELYHMSVDPSERTNLAADPNCAAMKARLATELDRWLDSQGDPGVPLDTFEAFNAAKQGQHRYFPAMPSTQQ